MSYYQFIYWVSQTLILRTRSSSSFFIWHLIDLCQKKKQTNNINFALFLRHFRHKNRTKSLTFVARALPNIFWQTTDIVHIITSLDFHRCRSSHTRNWVTFFVLLSEMSRGCCTFDIIFIFFWQWLSFVCFCGLECVELNLKVRSRTVMCVIWMDAT